MTKILVTGGSGQVGTALSGLTWPNEIELFVPGRALLDLGDLEQIKEFVLAGGFSAIVNAGAYTAVDRAEDELVEAYRINAMAPAALADVAASLDIPLVHVSTDYVFDGTKDGPYLEVDPIKPMSVYGASKASGELAVQNSKCRHVILRTAWVFSPVGTNFVKTMMRLSDRPSLRVVNDQVGCPTSALDIANALQTIVLRILKDPDMQGGVYHFCGNEQTTWYDFAREIFALLGESQPEVPQVDPIPTSEYPTAARRPANSALSTDRLLTDFGIQPCDWRAALANTIATLTRT